MELKSKSKNSLYISWQMLESKVEGLKQRIDNEESPPNPKNLPAMRARLANLERKAKEAREQYALAGGIDTLVKRNAAFEVLTADERIKAENLRHKVAEILSNLPVIRKFY